MLQATTCTNQIRSGCKAVSTQRQPVSMVGGSCLLLSTKPCFQAPPQWDRSYLRPQQVLKVTMNKLCARLFIIIFMTYTRKSECIPTVTNFASILANYFYFLRKITAQRPSVLNFRGRLVKFCQKSSGQTVRKLLFRSWFTKTATQNFM